MNGLGARDELFEDEFECDEPGIEDGVESLDEEEEDDNDDVDDIDDD
jgi:hypothetical protein